MDASSPLYRRLLGAGAFVILFLGVFFRVTHLGTKVYWNDEVYTSLWATGVDPLPYSCRRSGDIGTRPLSYQRLHPTVA